MRVVPVSEGSLHFSGRVIGFFLALALSANCQVSQVNYVPEWQHPNDWRAWLDQDVVAILTPAQRASFLALQGDTARRRYASLIWQGTSPDQHYKRLEYADTAYAMGGLRGSQTDRGLVYVKFGRPTDVYQFDSTGAGGPMREDWAWDGRCFSVHFERQETGEYRIVDGPYGTRAQILDAVSLGKFEACIGNQPAPRVRPMTEFEALLSPKECRCEGIATHSNISTPKRKQAGVEAFFLPLTKNTGRLTLFMSDRQSWLGVKRDASRQDLEFRGRIIAQQTGDAIITFRDYWAFNASPDTTWPMNRCERMFVSPGSYRLELTALERSTNSEVAHCSTSIEIPIRGNGSDISVSLGTRVCEYRGR